MVAGQPAGSTPAEPAVRRGKPGFVDEQESDSAHPDRTARITRCCSDVVAAGSPCDKESDGEPFAGEWSAHLARDLIATLLMGCWSCSDHVRVAGGVLAGHLGVASLYTRQGAAGAGMWDDRVLAE